MHTHKLTPDAPVHREFLNEQRKDSRTGKVFEEGDVIVFCASNGCRSAHLSDSWRIRNGCSACKGTNTLRDFPSRQTIRIGKGPRPSGRTFVIKTPYPQPVGVSPVQIPSAPQSPDNGCVVAIVLGVIVVILLFALRSCASSAPTKSSSAPPKEPSVPTPTRFVNAVPPKQTSPTTASNPSVTTQRDSDWNSLTQFLRERAKRESDIATTQFALKSPTPTSDRNTIVAQEDSDWNSLVQSLKDRPKEEAANARTQFALQSQPSGPDTISETNRVTGPVTYRVVNVEVNDYLNVRDGPGSDYPVVARLPPSFAGIQREERRYANGETIWQEISIAGTRGYVNEIYLAPVP